MSRTSRTEYPGAIYYLTNYNDTGDAIFRDGADYLRFQLGLGETCAKTDWQVHAFVLESTRFRVVLETPIANLVAGMHHFLSAYTTHFNTRHGLTGELFVHRYKSKLVDVDDSDSFRLLCDYVHLYPARAALLIPQQPLRHYAWSSLPRYLLSPADRPAWLRVDRVLGTRGIDHDDAAGRARFELGLEQCRASADNQLFRGIERGWHFGGDSIRRKLLERHAAYLRGKGQGGEPSEPGDAKARRIVKEELERLWWTPQDLSRHPKNDPEKIRMAQRLRAETAVPLKWIARELHMGPAEYLAQLLHKANKRQRKLIVRG